MPENVDIIENPVSSHASELSVKRPRISLSESDVASTSSSIVCDETENTNSNDSEANNINNDIITNVLKT